MSDHDSLWSRYRDFVRRYRDDVRRAKEIIEAGTIGPVQCFHANMVFDLHKEFRRDFVGKSLGRSIAAALVCTFEAGAATDGLVRVRAAVHPGSASAIGTTPVMETKRTIDRARVRTLL